MKKNNTLLLLSLALLLIQPLFSLAQKNDTDGRKKINAKVWAQAQAGATVDFVIVLAEQADVTAAAEKLPTKDAKGWFVFNTLKQTADRSQRRLIALLKAEKASFQSFFIVNALQAYGNARLLEQLAAQPEVREIIANPATFFDGAYSTQAPNAAERSGVEWGISKIKADSVWLLGFRGQGVTVGGQDTGYGWEVAPLKKKYRGYNAADSTVNHHYNWHDAIHEIDTHNITRISLYDTLFSSNGLRDSIVLAGFSFSYTENPCGYSISAPCDDSNHGTHTMGTMVGDDGEGNQIGVAPDARWIACRNMERGWGKPSTYIEAFEWFIAPTNLNGQNPNPSKSPHVINNSWGCPPTEGCDGSNFSIMAQVVTNVKAAGIVPVVSAGNGGSGCGSVNSPAAIFQNSFSVGATDMNDTIAGFSSRGLVTVDSSGRMKPNVSAPGVNVRSVVKDGTFANYSGTSMAGPHVVGAVALMISANPNLAGQVAIIERILEETAVPLTSHQECGGVAGTQIPNPIYGFGRIDALAAVKKALTTVISTNEDKTLQGSVLVSPNPTEGVFSLTFDKMYGTTTIQIFDATGRFLLREIHDLQGKNIVTLSMQSYPSGVYFYKIFNKNQVQQGKIIKQ